MRLGFIGVGKIVSAVIEGLCTSGIENITIHISPRNRENSINLAAKYSNVERLCNNQEVLDRSDMIFIALVPSVAASVLAELQFSAGHTVISLIALMAHNDVAAKVYPAVKVCRAIPLPPVAYHNCPIPIYKGSNDVVEIFEHIGQPLIIENEQHLHAIWTLTGLITPFYDLLKELSDWTMNKGVDEQVASQYIANMFQSLCSMARQVSPIHFSELAKHAATPSGMNEQAGKELREKGAHELYLSAADDLFKTIY